MFEELASTAEEHRVDRLGRRRGSNRRLFDPAGYKDVHESVAVDIAKRRSLAIHGRKPGQLSHIVKLNRGLLTGRVAGRHR